MSGFSNLYPWAGFVNSLLVASQPAKRFNLFLRRRLMVKQCWVMLLVLWVAAIIVWITFVLLNTVSNIGGLCHWHLVLRQLTFTNSYLQSPLALIWSMNPFPKNVHTRTHLHTCNLNSIRNLWTSVRSIDLWNSKCLDHSKRSHSDICWIKTNKHILEQI
jgi:hypothetical protein